jgi:hypothetical protein
MIQEALNSYRKNGYAILKNFMTPETCLAAVNEINKLIEGFEPKAE